MYDVRGREDEESPYVIVGTVELNPYLAYALIDYGSTHSFVCATVLDKLSMKPEIVKSSLVVSNPIGKNLPINLICKERPITTRGIPFPIDLTSMILVFHLCFVISEFIDVFLEELPGVPLTREVEFGIDI
ncbi:hypothetical protein V6N13_026646 [Hibiscus sabdariffa]